MQDFFTRWATKISRAMGSIWAFATAFLLILVWALSGPIFHFSSQWQLVVNTGTTIITFLMIFLLQNTQNRDAKAIHIKLDELIRAVKSARNNMIDAEELSEEKLDKMKETLTKAKKRGKLH